MQVTTTGLDLAKNVFQVHGITESDEVVSYRPLRRAQLLTFFSKIEPCLIGMEACSCAHHCARELTKFGYDVRLIPPMYVKPYVKRGKSDAIDAEAICETVKRPKMRFVAIKTVEKQSLLSLHRARDLLVRLRTKRINGLRSMVAEFGVYIVRGLARVIGFAEDILPGEVLDLPDIATEVIHSLCGQLMALRPDPLVRSPPEAGRQGRRAGAVVAYDPRRWRCDSVRDHAPALVTEISSAMAGNLQLGWV